MNNLSIGLRGHDIGIDFDDMIKNAALYDIKSVQLAMTRTVTDEDFYTIWYNKDVSNRIGFALKENGISVPVLSCYINPVERDEKKLEKDLILFENFIRYAKDFNAGVVGTETGRTETLEKTHSEENYQFFLKNLRRLIKVAEKYGVIIGIEPVNIFTIHSPEVMARLIEDISSDNLAVIFDLSNIITVDNYKNQRSIIDTSFELFGNRIRAIHLKDFIVENDEKRFTLVGTGMYDIKYLFSKLEKTSVMPDIILDETPVKDYKRSMENLKQIISV